MGNKKQPLKHRKKTGPPASDTPWHVPTAAPAVAQRFERTLRFLQYRQITQLTTTIGGYFRVRGEVVDFRPYGNTYAPIGPVLSSGVGVREVAEAMDDLVRAAQLSEDSRFFGAAPSIYRYAPLSRVVSLCEEHALFLRNAFGSDMPTYLARETSGISQVLQQARFYAPALIAAQALFRDDQEALRRIVVAHPALI